MERARIVVAVLVVFSLVASLVFIDGGITGFVSSQSFVRQIDLHIEESQRFSLRSVDGVPLSLSSLSVSGNIVGAGLVKVYLVGDGWRRLVFSNAVKEQRGMDSITGMFVSDVVVESGPLLENIESVPAGFNAQSGSFKEACVETCMLEASSSLLYLDVVIEPGTVVDISELVFTVPVNTE